VPDQPAAGLRIRIAFSGLCWIAATADGKQVLYRLLDMGEDTYIEAADDIVLRVGDPDKITFTINDAAGRRFGAPGEPVTLHITRENYRQFLADARPGPSAVE
jgi:hypothetical protein